MDTAPVDPNLAPPTWKRILVWYGTVWLAGVIAGFVLPNTDNTSYKIGDIFNHSSFDIASFLQLFIASLVSPLTLVQGLFFLLGNTFQVMGLFLLITMLLCWVIYVGHFIFFLVVEEKSAWLMLYVVLVGICLASIIGCTINIGPHLW